MAKKAKSRINRKTKRIIRRSIAGLLMVTAIGIAAIPRFCNPGILFRKLIIDIHLFGGRYNRL